jgi:hypothetical protein
MPVDIEVSDSISVPRYYTLIVSKDSWCRSQQDLAKRLSTFGGVNLRDSHLALCLLLFMGYTPLVQIFAEKPAPPSAETVKYSDTTNMHP